MRLSSVAAGACSLALAVTLTAAPATAGGHPHSREPRVVADGLVGPLSLAVSKQGTVTVTQSFAGAVSQIDRRGGVSTIYQIDPEAGGISGAADRRGGTYHLETTVGPEGAVTQVIRLERDGARTVISDDLWAFERENNPDGGQTYGFTGLDDECAAQVAAIEEATGFPLNEYPGIVESNGYQLAVDHGRIYVADAAANAILAVDASTGAISTVAVVPASETTFTAEAKAFAEAQIGTPMPDCVLGASYTPEPVPTDVEVGRSGRLYVSTLQGSLGEGFPLSRIYRISPESGRVRLVADRGMQGVTGLALGPDGRIVVSELFDGEVSFVSPGSTRARTLFEAESPADVEVRDSTVYATTGVFGEEGAPGNGAVVAYRYRSGR